MKKQIFKALNRVNQYSLGSEQWGFITAGAESYTDEIWDVRERIRLNCFESYLYVMFDGDDRYERERWLSDHPDLKLHIIDNISGPEDGDNTGIVAVWSLGVIAE